MKNEFVKLGDAMVRFSKVTAVVEVLGIPGQSDVYFDGSEIRIRNPVDEIFKELDAAQVRYGQERLILDLVCRLEGSRSIGSKDEIEIAERDLSRAVRDYMGWK